jgi:tRNA (guanine-N7-)-methyltransferase
VSTSPPTTAKFPSGPAPDPAGSHDEHRIRTFHARRGRITQAQAASIERHWAAWGVELDGARLDLAELFGAGPSAVEVAETSGPGSYAAEVPGPEASGAGASNPPEVPAAAPSAMPVVVEIGFGMGDATARMAAADPSTGILAVDVHTPGQGNLLSLADRAGLTNVRVANGDAIVLLRDMLAPATLDGLRVYFPDPWPKAKHHKRRLIQPDFLALVTPLLRPGALVHCATDWEPYAEQMLEVLSAAPGLTNRCGEGFAPRPDFRPMTKFERQGLAKGHTVRDLLFVRA